MLFSAAFVALVASALACGDHDHSHFAKRQQIEAPNSTSLPRGQLPWGKLNFLHTTDTHGWLEGHLKEANYGADFGDLTSFISHMRDEADRRNVDLLLVDSGDLHDGNGLSDTTTPDGTFTDSLIEKVNYDILTIGNHELYVPAVTEDVYKNFAPKWKGKYLTSNVNYTVPGSNTSTPIGSLYRSFKTKRGVSVTATGFLFNFTGNGNNSIVQPVAQAVAMPWFQNMLATEGNKTDVFVVAGHTPIRNPEFQSVLSAIRAKFPVKPVIFLGGHTHIRDFAIFDANSYALESGRYLETVGFMGIDGFKTPSSGKNLTVGRRYLDNNRATYEYHTGTTDGGKKGKGKTGKDASKPKKGGAFDTPLGVSITKQIAQGRKQLNTTFLFGCAPQSYYLSAVPPSDNASIFNLLSNDVLPKAVANTTNNPNYQILINAGSQRFDLFKGPFTLDDSFIVSPFTDYFQYLPGIKFSTVQKVLPYLNNYSGGSSKVKRDQSYAMPHSSTMFSVDEHYKSWLEANYMHYVSNANVAAANTSLTPGYVTMDDGTNIASIGPGDDTVHSAIPFYNSPEYIGTPLDNSTDPNASFDLVFFDFFASSVVKAVNKISGSNYTTANVKSYPTDVLAQTMLNKYAQLYWKSNGTCSTS